MMEMRGNVLNLLEKHARVHELSGFLRCDLMNDCCELSFSMVWNLQLKPTSEVSEGDKSEIELVMVDVWNVGREIGKNLERANCIETI